MKQRHDDITEWHSSHKTQIQKLNCYSTNSFPQWASICSKARQEQNVENSCPLPLNPHKMEAPAFFFPRYIHHNVTLLINNGKSRNWSYYVKYFFQHNRIRNSAHEWEDNQKIKRSKLFTFDNVVNVTDVQRMNKRNNSISVAFQITCIRVLQNPTEKWKDFKKRKTKIRRNSFVRRKIRDEELPANTSKLYCSTFRPKRLNVTFTKCRRKNFDYSLQRSNLRTLEEGMRAHPTISSIGDVINPLSSFFLSCTFFSLLLLSAFSRSFQIRLKVYEKTCWLTSGVVEFY